MKGEEEHTFCLVLALKLIPINHTTSIMLVACVNGIELRASTRQKVCICLE